MTLAQRAAAYEVAFPRWPSSWPRVVREQGRDVLYATWVIGNDYRNRSGYYGSYPPGYLPRVMALFPDARPELTLHAFSGSLPAGPYLRCDMRPDMGAELRCAVAELPVVCSRQRFRLVLADPPYSPADAERYGTPMVNKREAIVALARVTLAGGYLAWLDTCWPMHRKRQWLTVGRILVQRSTNHRVRVLTLFERTAEEA